MQIIGYHWAPNTYRKWLKKIQIESQSRGLFIVVESLVWCPYESFLNSVRWVTVIPTLLLINSYINLLTLFFSNFGPFGRTNGVGYPLKVKHGGFFVARANAISSIQSRFRRPSKSKDNWLPIVLPEILIFKYRPMDIIVLIMFQPASFTISPQHLVSFFPLFYSCK